MLEPFCDGRRISDMILRSFAAEIGIAPGTEADPQVY